IYYFHDIVGPGRDRPHRAVAGDEPGMAPAVALAQVDECRPVLEPVERRAWTPVDVIVVDVDPGAVALDEQRLRRAGGRLAHPERVLRLAAVELLNHELR